MTKSEEMKGKIGEIEKVMKKNKSLRNDDRKLTIYIWRKEISDIGYSIISFSHFYSIGKLTSADSITRLARLIRKKHNWKKDKSKEEKKVKKFVNKINLSNNSFQKLA